MADPFEQPSSATEPDDRPPRNGRVLVCEDSATVRAFFRSLLLPLYEVEAVSSGENAVIAAPRFLPDVILCDLMLPGIPGTEVCRRIRQIPELCAVPFVLVTALAGEENRALGLESGADDYLVKPVRERELLARVASLVRLRRVTRELEERTRALEEANAALRALEQAGVIGGPTPARSGQEMITAALVGRSL